MLGAARSWRENLLYFCKASSMLKLLPLFLGMALPLFLQAQFPRFAHYQVQLQVGWTASKIQPQAPRFFTPSQLSYQAEYFELLHHPFAALGLAIDYRRLYLETGLSYLALGASSTPLSPKQAWTTHYCSIPFLVGYQYFIAKHSKIILAAGTELALPIAEHPQQGYGGAPWGSCNILVGLQAQWKAFALGARLHIGLTKFRYVQETTLRHSGCTLYLAYRVWDSKKMLLKKPF